MTPRRRIKPGLCPNLYESDGLYRYRHPYKKTWHNLGRDKAKAVKAAKELNAILLPNHETLIRGVMGLDNKTVKDLILKFKEEILPKKELKERSLYEINYRLNRIEKDIGHWALTKLSTQKIAYYLDINFKGDAYKQHRSVLNQLCRTAVVKGWMKENPVEATLPTLQGEKIKKQRSRLTVEQYQAIYQFAEPWLQIAMDLALTTLQRRSDLLQLKFTDIKDGRLYLVQSKTEKHGDAARLSIHVGHDLQAIIQRARSSGVLSPFIIHRKPLQRQRKQLEAKAHWTAITPRYLSDAFAQARDKTDLFTSVPQQQRPTFHEIRALGGHLYEQHGRTKAEVRSLMGHTTDKMTEHYLQGHVERWTMVDADFRLDWLKE
ncbi:tyrosine-type recombinase/integrase [Endozoicomonas sp. SM1973]|uniref:Tyrosine-type recombinase/integrase n=1 Tax=Spartinivicinus marinus TaxID=2994442 RepID=A0A853I5G3_9GAMM|nr:tyrosine-type recombinase/integrase [Spartinivicinus marinus]MCX4025208.1 tyrosine-type recombinase/integrase [Spartinivicinus marinus]NYZ65928.1 tyrosine-type recombinase/integrase [Spartinivicinus marinus]